MLAALVQTEESEAPRCSSCDWPKPQTEAKVRYAGEIIPHSHYSLFNWRTSSWESPKFVDIECPHSLSLSIPLNLLTARFTWTLKHFNANIHGRPSLTRCLETCLSRRTFMLAPSRQCALLWTLVRHLTINQIVCVVFHPPQPSLYFKACNHATQTHYKYVGMSPLVTCTSYILGWMASTASALCWDVWMLQYRKMSDWVIGTRWQTGCFAVNSVTATTIEMQRVSLIVLGQCNAYSTVRTFSLRVVFMVHNSLGILGYLLDVSDSTRDDYLVSLKPRIARIIDAIV